MQTIGVEDTTEVIRVLIVEDLPTDAELEEREIRLVLPASEFLCVELREDFLTALESFRPDIILSDYKLPHFDGMTALKLALERAPEIPFILITGSMNEETAVECMKAGAWDYIIKEHVKRLGLAVLNVLAQKKQRSEKKLAEEQFRKSAEIYRKLFEDHTAVKMNIDPNSGNIIDANKAAAKFYGWSREQLKHMHLSEISTLSPEKTRETIEKARTLERTYFEFRHRLADGTVRDVEVFSGQIEANSEKILHAIIYDITDRKKTEASLAASEAEFRRLSQEFHGLLDAIPDSLTLQDKNLRILWANRGATMGLEKSPEELVGQSCYEVWFNRSEPCEHCPVQESFATGQPASITNTTPDGRIWDLRTIPLTDNIGEVATVIEVRRDITEHRKLEAQFQQAQKMETVGRLAGGVAHDFNNMLTIIIGYGEIVLSKLNANDPNYHDIAQILEAGRRSANLTRQLLAFSRQQTILPQVSDVNKLISNSLKMLHRLVGTDVDLRFTPKNNIWEIKIDPTQVDQILANLTVNATDAIAGVGSINIETDNVVLDESCSTFLKWSTPGDYVLLVFSDTGSGMDKETLTKIFEPFFTTKEKDKGTGLGLATVYGIVKQNSGFINVYSEPGHGTSFKIYFPRHCGPVENQEKKQVEFVQGGHETILLVENEPQILAMCKGMLEQQGYIVITAVQPGEAMVLCEEYQDKIHLLVSDVIMPTMNGKELQEKITLIRPGIRVLFMSGYTSDKISREGVLAEGINFIQKPFSRHDFLLKIRQVLDQRVL